VGRGDSSQEPYSSYCGTTVNGSRFLSIWSSQQILTDRGSEFESDLFKALLSWMEIDKLRSTASCNGQVERFHRTLNSMLAKVVADNHRNWDDCVPFVLAAYRASQHEATGYTPNKLFLGRENRMPLDILMGLPSEESSLFNSLHGYLVNLQEDISYSYAVARHKLQNCALRRKKYYDVRVREKQFKVGDWVYYYYPCHYRSKSPKWQKAHTGPFLVVSTIPPSNCVLQKSHKSKEFVVHMD